jgi:hypothetical protein
MAVPAYETGVAGLVVTGPVPAKAPPISEDDDVELFSLTHARSGLALLYGYTIGSVRDAAAYLELIDWTRPAAELQRDSDAREAVEQALRCTGTFQFLAAAATDPRDLDEVTA